MKYRITVNGMSCSHCVDRVTKALTELPEAASVSVELNAGIAEVETSASKSQVTEAIEELGFTVKEIMAQ